MTDSQGAIRSCGGTFPPKSTNHASAQVADNSGVSDSPNIGRTPEQTPGFQRFDALGAHEDWRDVVGFEGLYRVSNLGRVRGPRGWVIRTFLNHNGYPHVVVGGKRRFLHKVVAEAFHGPRPAGYEIDHLDNDRENCAASNLEYVTRDENVRRKSERSKARRTACIVCGEVPPDRNTRQGRCSGCLRYLARTGRDRSPEQALKARSRRESLRSFRVDQERAVAPDPNHALTAPDRVARYVDLLRDALRFADAIANADAYYGDQNDAAIILGDRIRAAIGGVSHD